MGEAREVGGRRQEGRRPEGRRQEAGGRRPGRGRHAQAAGGQEAGRRGQCGVTDIALRLVPTVAELKHSFHLSFSIERRDKPAGCSE